MKKIFFLMLVVCFSFQGTLFSKDKLVISTWGYNGDLLKKYIYEPFEKKYGVEIVLETGSGPSGLPHIGTFGEVFRTTMVRNALKTLTDLPTKLIAFSEFMTPDSKLIKSFSQE